MDRQELSGERSLAFSAWIRECLPDSCSGFTVTNLDWVFWNYKNRILLLAEEKMYRGKLRFNQSQIFKEIIAPSLKEYCENHDIQFLGFHLIQFENTSPKDGRIWWDGTEISETELIDRLSW